MVTNLNTVIMHEMNDLRYIGLILFFISELYMSDWMIMYGWMKIDEDKSGRFC